MHFLPGRLSSSTLGDVLGILYRRSITGTVELSEIAGPRGFAGRSHRLHLRAGHVVAIETDLGASRSLRERLDALFRIEDARVAFRTARPLPATATWTPLGPQDFLHGRPRARDRQAGRRMPPPPAVAVDDPFDRARRLLGISKDAAVADVRRAFRRLAAALHPDRAGAESAARFAELSAAYHVLVA